jgi:ribosomal protein S3AE
MRNRPFFFYPDIYNKLYIMIKQTWEVSNEERNRILSLHESATKNLYLMSEQISTYRRRGVDVISSTQDPKIQNYLDTVDLNYLQKATNMGTKEFTQTVTQMEGMMDETSLQVFEKMKNENPKFYFYVISRYMGPKQYGYKDPRGPGVFDTRGYDRSLVKDKKIIVDNSTTIKNEVDPGKVGEVPTVPIEEQGYQMITSPEIKQPMQFAYNEAVMTPEFKKYIDNEIFGSIDEGIKNMTVAIQEEGRKPVDVYVPKMILKSSCSTTPNGVSKQTFPGKIPTFQELSDARAKVVYDYLVQGLQKRNAYFNPEGIVIDSKGTNAGKQIKIKSGDKTITVDGTGTSGPEYTGQKGEREELANYQRVELSLDYAVRGTTPPLGGDAEPDNIPSEFIPETENEYIVRFTATGRKKLEIRIPKITIPGFSKSGYYNKRVKFGCPPRGGW